MLNPNKKMVLGFFNQVIFLDKVCIVHKRSRQQGSRQVKFIPNSENIHNNMVSQQKCLS